MSLVKPGGGFHAASSIHLMPSFFDLLSQSSYEKAESSSTTDITIEQQNIVESMLNGKEFDIDGEEGLKSLETLMAARESFNKGGIIVNLPLSRTKK